MRLLLMIMLISLFILSCKNTKSPDDKNSIPALTQAYNETKEDSTFTKLMQAYGAEYLDATNNETREKLLTEVIVIADKAERPEYSEIFQVELIKTNPNHPQMEKILFGLGENMLDKNKLDVASFLFEAYQKKFPKATNVKEAGQKVLSNTIPNKAYIDLQARALFAGDNSKGIDLIKAENYIDLCEAFVLVNPTDPEAPVYLFKAAEMARAINSSTKFMGLYDWIVNFYPKYDKASLALFMKAFAYDNELKDYKNAKKYYERFLRDYGQDSLAYDVRFLLDNLGKSGDEIIESIVREKQPQ